MFGGDSGCGLGLGVGVCRRLPLAGFEEVPAKVEWPAFVAVDLDGEFLGLEQGARQLEPILAEVGSDCVPIMKHSGR